MNLTWLFVAVVYAVAVAIARRAGIDLPRRVALFFYALVLVFFWQALTGPYVNVAVDNTVANPPWSFVRHDRQVAFPELTDHATQIVPWAHQARESWKAFQAPLWNHHSASGYSLVGGAQSSALSLIRLIALPLPLGRAFTAEGAFKVLIALTFTFLYCRRRYSLLASVLGAVTFGFSAFIAGWLHFPVATVACFAPAVLYCVDLLAERITFPRFLFATLLWSQVLMAGHPEVAAHLFWLAAMYMLWIVLVLREPAQRRRFVLTLGGVATVAALLAAPYLATVAETVSRSWRRVALGAVPFEKRVIPHTDLNAAILTLQPHFFGEMPLDVPWAQANVESIGGYAGVFGVAAWIAVAAFVIWRRQWRSREAFFALLTLFAIGVIFAWPVFTQLFHWTMPIAAHARLRYLLVLLLAIQSAAAVDFVRAEGQGLRAEGENHDAEPSGFPSRPLALGPRPFLLAGIAAVAATLLALLHTIPFPFAYYHDTAVLAMLPSVAVLGVAAAVAMTRRRAAVLLLLVAVIAELFTIGMARNTPIHERRMYPTTPIIEKLQALQKAAPANAPFRIAGVGAQFFPNASGIYGLEDIRAHDPMANARYLGFLMMTAGYEPWNYFAVLPDADRSVYDFLNVKYVILEPGAELKDPGRYTLIYDGPDGRLLENRNVLPRFHYARNVILEWNHETFYKKLREHHEWRTTALLNEIEQENDQQYKDFFSPRAANAPLAVVRMERAAPTAYTIRVTAPRWSLVASSIPGWRGWKVERNGERVQPFRVNGEFLAFAVPPGESTVRVWYAPASWWVGVGVSVLTVVGLLVWGGLLASRTAGSLHART
ncbi:MAG TPA: YfhO family protein [Thermoanaerobaculia bacterium]|nr:YfhO family protein [Thermoanaerobaculia bacterium]